MPSTNVRNIKAGVSSILWRVCVCVCICGCSVAVLLQPIARWNSYLHVLFLPSLSLSLSPSTLIFFAPPVWLTRLGGGSVDTKVKTKIINRLESTWNGFQHRGALNGATEHRFAFGMFAGLSPNCCFFFFCYRLPWFRRRMVKWSVVHRTPATAVAALGGAGEDGDDDADDDDDDVVDADGW